MAFPNLSDIQSHLKLVAFGTMCGACGYGLSMSEPVVQVESVGKHHLVLDLDTSDMGLNLSVDPKQEPRFFQSIYG